MQPAKLILVHWVAVPGRAEGWLSVAPFIHRLQYISAVYTSTSDKSGLSQPLLPSQSCNNFASPYICCVKRATKPNLLNLFFSPFTVRAIRLKWLRVSLEQCRTKVPSTSLSPTCWLAFSTRVKTSGPKASRSSGKKTNVITCQGNGCLFISISLENWLHQSRGT